MTNLRWSTKVVEFDAIQYKEGDLDRLIEEIMRSMKRCLPSRSYYEFGIIMDNSRDEFYLSSQKIIHRANNITRKWGCKFILSKKSKGIVSYDLIKI